MQPTLNTWLHIRNLQVFHTSEGIILLFRSQSKILDLSSDRIIALNESIREKMAEVERVRPFTSVNGNACAKSIHLRCAFTPIKQILEATNEVHHYRCRARILACSPQNTKQWARIWCSQCELFTSCVQEQGTVDKCGHCKSQEFMKYEYVIQMVLEDATGIFSVIAFGDHAAKLFPHIPADNLYIGTTTASELDQLYLFATHLGK
jgi:hypothetical protein